jgi:hypothetical protein
MAENIINKFLQLDNPDIARQTRNMSYGDAFKTENPFSKSYQGYRPGYTGADKVGLGGYVKQGINSLTGNFQQGSNVGGATPLTRKLAQDTMRFAPKALGTLASLPAQAAFFTLGSTPANASEANMSPEDFRALAEAEGMTFGSSPITSSPINLDERYADQLAPGAYGKMGENVYTKMDDGSTRMDPYASQKFYDDEIFNNYFATNRYEDFSPRVGNMSTSTPQIGDAISRPNVQSQNYNMDQSFYMNPNSVERPQNMFQRFGGAMQDGIGSLKDVAGKGIDLGKMAMSGIGNAIMPGLGFVGNLLSGIDRFDTLSPEDQSFILEQAGGNRPAKDPFGINIRSARGNYADYVRNKGIYAKGKRGDYYRNLQQQINDKKVQAAEQLRAEQARIEAAYRSQAGQYGGDNRQQEREDAGPGYSGSGTAAEMGSFRDGGLASMFVRRG